MLLLLTLAGRAGAQEPIIVPAVVRATTIQILVTNDSLLSPRLQSEAEQTAGQLFAALGIRIEWVDHLNPDLPLVVAFPPSGGAERMQLGPYVMGHTFRTRAPEPGGRALIFVDRVEQRAQSSRVDVGRLLGAVIAHEIAHMLLPDAHTATGIMRGIWNDHDLRLIEMGFLRFSATQRDQMVWYALLRRFP